MSGKCYKRKKMFFISDALDPPDDEGIKKFSQELYKMLRRRSDIEVKKILINKMSFVPRKTFFSSLLRKELRREDPDIVIYIPRASATMMSLFRSYLLQRYHPRSRKVLFSLQCRELPDFASRLFNSSFRCSLTIFTLEKEYSDYLERIGFRTYLITPGVDHAKFTPISAETKKNLRRKWSLPEKGKVGLHVGHITAGRGLDLLIELKNTIEIEILVVASSAFPPDSKLERKLKEKGIRVIRKYIPPIQELYQAADVYLFTSTHRGAVIDMPLSIIEAMAVNLPVVTFPIGSVKYLNEDQERGFFVAHDREEFFKKTVIALGMDTVSTWEIAKRFDWNRTVENLFQIMNEKC